MHFPIDVGEVGELPQPHPLHLYHKLRVGAGGHVLDALLSPAQQEPLIVDIIIIGQSTGVDGAAGPIPDGQHQWQPVPVVDGELDQVGGGAVAPVDVHIVAVAIGVAVQDGGDGLRQAENQHSPIYQC